MPHYALWSPTGDRLALVAQGRAGLTLFLSEADGPLIADPIQTGAPLFLAWSPDGGRLAVHAGVNLSVLELAEARASRPISADARGFRTPAFSDDGHFLAFATPDGDGDGVIVRVAAGSGDVTEAVGEFSGGVALAFRPGARTLSVAVTTRPASGAFDELWTIDLGAGGRPELLLRRPFSSVLWDPTGEKLAFIVPSATGDGSVSLHARLASGEFLGASAPFMPSPDYQTIAGFFDQYGRSHRLWAPDGSAFLGGGTPPYRLPRRRLPRWFPRRAAPLAARARRSHRADRRGRDRVLPAAARRRLVPSEKGRSCSALPPATPPPTLERRLNSPLGEPDGDRSRTSCHPRRAARAPSVVSPSPSSQSPVSCLCSVSATG